MPLLKHARIYKMTEPLQVDAAGLEVLLAAHKFTPCMGQDALKLGFTYPVHPSIKSYCHAVADDILLVALKRQEKNIPAAVIAEELQPKIDALQAEKGRPIGRREKQALKEELIQTLLPRAFAKSTVYVAAIDLKAGYVIVNTNSASRAEDLLALLRKAIGSLPLVPWCNSHSLSNFMQSWLAEKDLPAGYVLGHAAKLKAPDEEGAKATFDNQLLSAQEVQSHLEDKLVTELVLSVPEQYEFKIKDCGAITGIKWHDIIANTNDEMGWEDLELRLNADWILCIDQMRNVIASLIGLIGEPVSRVSVSAPESEAGDADIEAPGLADQKYAEAEAFVILSRKASVSAVQRQFRIGYNRAARLIEAMEAKGVVSAPDHLGNREVLK